MRLRILDLDGSQTLQAQIATRIARGEASYVDPQSLGPKMRFSASRDRFEAFETRLSALPGNDELKQTLAPLSLAFPLASLSYCGVLLASRFVLGEAVSRRRWLGVGLITAGVAIVCAGA
jgi:hypothetical protein